MSGYFGYQSQPCEMGPVRSCAIVNDRRRIAGMQAVIQQKDCD